MKKILLLGATGKTGTQVVNVALDEGYDLHCLARNSQRIKAQEGITVFEGSVLKTDDLERSLIGCDAVISVLNINLDSMLPWAKPSSPPTFMSDVMKLLVPLAEKHGVKRVAICSTLGVFDTKKNLPLFFKFVVNTTPLRIVFADHERQETVLSNSNLDWTIIRPVGLNNSIEPETIRESIDNKAKLNSQISRKSVAKALVDSLKRNDLIGKRVAISKD